MLKILSGLEMKAVDKKAIEELNIPSLILMENAGRAVFGEVNNLVEEHKIDFASAIVICGKGNNGGDGFVAARHLIENDIQTTVISLYRKDDLSGDALVNHDILEHFTEIIYFEDIDCEKLKDLISESDFVIDAILGTGINSEVKGDLKKILEIINHYREGLIVSVDIPSGINADNGEVLGIAITADYTVTFHSLKFGHINHPGASYSGEVIVVPIGIPEFLTEGDEFNSYLITENYVRASIPTRPDDSHKGTFGNVLTVAGSLEMPGAAFMSAFSSLKSGAGYSVLACPESIIPKVSQSAPEIVYKALKETEFKSISTDALDGAMEKAENADIILVGPGLTTHTETVEFVSDFIQKLADTGKPSIIDADALNCLSIRQNYTLPVNSVITPHPKELSRLLNISVDEILNDRLKFAKLAAEKFNTIVVLKGANTVIAMPEGITFINNTGNSGLATAGSGDVLAGMIAGFAAQGCELKDAAILGVYIHGLAADLAVEEVNEYSLTPSILMEYIPDAISSILK